MNLLLDGYKTYIVAALIGIIAAAKYLGYIDDEVAVMLYTILTGGGLAALRRAVD